MLSLTIMYAGIFLELVIFIRSLQAKTFAKYAFFYSYIALTLAGSILLYGIWKIDPDSYDRFYWVVQLLTLLAGCGIILEVLKHVLADYPGARKFAKIAGSITFGAVFCFAVIYALVARSGTPGGTNIDIERDFRTVQAIFLFGISGVIAYYAIALGRNMKGMIVGYGLYIGTSLISLALRSYAGLPFDEAWNIIQPLSYDVSLCIWLVALWSYAPNPVPEADTTLESDYEAVVAATRSAMTTMRSYLVRAVRP